MAIIRGRRLYQIFSPKGCDYSEGRLIEERTLITPECKSFVLKVG